MIPRFKKRTRRLSLLRSNTLFNKRDYTTALRFWRQLHSTQALISAGGRDGLFSLVRELPSILRSEPGTIMRTRIREVHGAYSGFGQPITGL